MEQASDNYTGRAHVVFRLGDGRLVRVAPNGIIGRASSAELYLPNPRVSEAHAMVSLRGHRLKLLQLRRPIVVDGKPYGQVTLQAGMKITLTRGVELVVEHVELPANELQLHGVCSGPLTLSEERYSIFLAGAHEVAEKGVRVERGPVFEVWFTHADGALAHVWSCGNGWALQVQGCEPDLVRPGATWILENQELHFECSAREQVVHSTHFGRPLKPTIGIRVEPQSVHILDNGAETVAFRGAEGELFAQVALAHQHKSLTYWRELVTEALGDVNDEKALRKRQDEFYGHMKRIRDQLYQHGLPRHLIRSDGFGEWALDRDLVREVVIAR